MEPRDISRRDYIKLLGVAALAPATILSGCSRGRKPNLTALTAIRMQQPWVNDAEFIGYFAAKTEGFYTQHGLDVVNQTGGPEIVPEVRLTKHLADIALTTPDNTLSLVTKQSVPLRIVGTQYQKSPMGIVTLVKSGIKSPKDLIGKKVAVPPVNTLTFEAFLKINNISPAEVSIESYNYDPMPLVKGTVDATLDFVTNVEYTVDNLIQKRVAQGELPSESVTSGGMKATSFLLADYGFEIMMDTVCVTDEFLRDNRAVVKRWLQASRMGWQYNFKDVSASTIKHMTPFLAETNRSLEQELAFNKRQQSLIESPSGVFFMSQDSIRKTVTALNLIGIQATAEMFDNSIVEELLP